MVKTVLCFWRRSLDCVVANMYLSAAASPTPRLLLVGQQAIDKGRGALIVKGVGWLNQRYPLGYSPAGPPSTVLPPLPLNELPLMMCN